MKRLSICWIIGCLLELVACRPEVPTQAEQGETDVFPDYREVTVPVNMAPPNFKLVDQQLQGIIRLKTMNGELIIAADHGVFNLPETDWKVLSQDAQGKQIDVTVYFREPQSDWKQMSFPIYVSRDSVDAYLVYRRIFPGYRMWNEMGIYQRCVENYVEKSILDNQSTNNSCMNCHAFCERQGEQMLFHQRGSHNGTYLIDHRQVKKIALERDGKPASFVYPYWHPSGRYVAFSTNETHQDFHLSDENRIEVYDVESDVLKKELPDIPPLRYKQLHLLLTDKHKHAKKQEIIKNSSCRKRPEKRLFPVHILNRLLFHQPSLDVTGHRGEVHADLKNLPRITRKGKRILSLLNLAQRLLGGAVQLEFHHVDIAIGL